MKDEIREKCKYFGLVYLGEWEGKHWALKEMEPGLPYHGGTLYELQNEFLYEFKKFN